MIKAWYLHALTSGVRARVPFAERLRTWKRRVAPYRPDTSNDTFQRQVALDLLAEAVRHHGPLSGQYVEIGPGWTPLVSAVFYAAGCERVVLCDLTPYLDEVGLARAKEMALAAADRIAALSGRSREDVRARLADFDPDYRAPCHIRELPNGSAQIVLSRAVLEHVPAGDLPETIAASRALLADDGLAIHWIDNSDHFEHRDKSISRLNFLTFSPRQWQMIEAVSATSQNRWRHSDYHKLFVEQGFSVLSEWTETNDEAREFAANTQLDAAFDDYHPDDLAILSSRFVLSKAPE